MAGNFFDSWNSSLGAAADAFGEPFTVDGVSYDALNIEEVDAPTRAALGSRFVDARLTLEITREVVAAAGIKRGTRLEARGQKLEVIEPKDDGSGSLTFFCGPQAGGTRG